MPANETKESYSYSNLQSYDTEALISNLLDNSDVLTSCLSISTPGDFIALAGKTEFAINLSKQQEVQDFFAQKATAKDFIAITKINGRVAEELAKSEAIQHFFCSKATGAEFIELSNIHNPITHDFLYRLQLDTPGHYSVIPDIIEALVSFEKYSKSFDLVKFFNHCKALQRHLIKAKPHPTIFPLKKKIEFMQLLDNILDNLKPIAKQNEEKNTEKDICRGLYQEHVSSFTYHLKSVGLKSESEGMLFDTKKPYPSTVCKNTNDKSDFVIYPIINQLGLRCTASVPCLPTIPIEIQINFYGTLDFASALADMERNGPGDETLKLHEKELLTQVNNLIYTISRKYSSYAQFKLRVAGHSLGGALAKNFTHSLLRAIAIQNHTPSQIIARIRKNLNKSNENIPATQLESLEEQLATDKANFKDSLNSLKKIEHIVVYALGAPGVSVKTDKEATLLTYYHHENFLWVYNQFHDSDIIPKFGPCEFLSGKNGNPRIVVNKVIRFKINLTEEEIKQSGSLPFPKITKRVMAAHKKKIYGVKDVQSEVSSTPLTPQLIEKFKFSEGRRQCHEAGFKVVKSLASIPFLVKHVVFLQSWPAHPVIWYEAENKYVFKLLQQFQLRREKSYVQKLLAIPQEIEHQEQELIEANGLLQRLKDHNKQQPNPKLTQYIINTERQIQSQIKHHRSLKNFIIVMEIRLEKEQNKFVSRQEGFFSKKEALSPSDNQENNFKKP